MAGWLEKILAPPAQDPKGRNLPMQSQRGNLPTRPEQRLQTPQNLPNATIIYGIGASLLFVAAFYLLLSARWFPAFIVFALGVCLTGFALHLLKHQD